MNIIGIKLYPFDVKEKKLVRSERFNWSI